MHRILCVSVTLLWLVNSCIISAVPINRPESIYRPQAGRNGAIAAAEPYATQAGLDVLKRGGNAVDAAVTVGFCLAVTLPRAGNIGGGGFLVYFDAETGKSHALDYRESAPAEAHRDMFLDPEGNADPDLSRYSPLATGVPGTVAGLLEAHRKFGSLPLKDLLAPAIQMAKHGVPVHGPLKEQFEIVSTSDTMNETAKNVYLGKDRRVPEIGEIFKQPELARTLEGISKDGEAGFYKGRVAEDIVQTLSESGGKMTLTDLESYKPIWRKPVTGEFRGHTIISMPPPSSGGVHLVQMLQLLENFDLRKTGHNSTRSTYLMIEVMKQAYADRSKFLGDPDFTDVPVQQILSEEYEQLVLGRINTDNFIPTPSTEISPGMLPMIEESPQTTQFSIVDKWGNAVSNTYTLNFSFGSGIMTNKTGILLNNEMDDFSAKAGVPNAYGLIGGSANSVEAGKRPLSSMTPTIVLKDGSVYAVTGSPGGSRIINTVLHVVLNLLEFDMNAAEANHAPRFHHQWFPDVVEVERGFPAETLRSMKLMGCQVEMSSTIGSAQTIVRLEDGSLTASSDPRRFGGTALTY